MQKREREREQMGGKPTIKALRAKERERHRKERESAVTCQCRLSCFCLQWEKPKIPTVPVCSAHLATSSSMLCSRRNLMGGMGGVGGGASAGAVQIPLPFISSPAPCPASMSTELVVAGVFCKRKLCCSAR